MPLENLRFLDDDDDIFASLPVTPSKEKSKSEEEAQDGSEQDDIPPPPPPPLPPPQENEDTDDKVILGISLSTLVLLEEKLRGTFDQSSDCEDEIEALSLREVHDRLIAAMKSPTLSYCQSLPQSSKGPPDFFVSCSSNQSFVTVVSDLRSAAVMLLPHKEEDEVFCYFDLLSLCRSPSIKGEDIISATRRAIEASSYTLLLMDENGELLNLSWVLFHLWTAKESKSDLRVACGNVVNAARVAKTLSLPSFNPYKSKCREESEKEAILSLFKTEGAIKENDSETLRMTISQLLLDASLRELDTLSKLSQAPQEYQASAWTKAGAFYQALGLLSEAEGSHEKAATLMEQIGHNNGLLACSELALGEVLVCEKDFKKAEIRLRRAFEIQTASLGSIHHPDALRAARKLVVALKRNGKFQDAISLSQQVYDACLEMTEYGPGHIVTAGSALSLSVCFRKSKMYAEAGALAEKALAIFDKVGGETSSLSLETLGLLRDLSKRAKDRDVYDKWKRELRKRSPEDENLIPSTPTSPLEAIIKQKSKVRRETDMF